MTDSRTGELLCDTYQSDGYSRIHFDGDAFSIAADKDNHPVVGIRWFGAIAYCNWLSRQCSLSPCYFCHQLIGGDPQGRGGVEWVPFYEMGGHNIDGSRGFDQHRPGWEKPLHQLIVDNNVTIFFHGHDHVFAKQELDGVIYQLVPQPSHHNFKKANQAEAYGYRSGVILPNSGHLRVSVRPSDVAVDYLRAYLPETESSERINGQISYTYRVELHTDAYASQ